MTPIPEIISDIVVQMRDELGTEAPYFEYGRMPYIAGQVDEKTKNIINAGKIFPLIALLGDIKETVKEGSRTATITVIFFAETKHDYSNPQRYSTTFPDLHYLLDLFVKYMGNDSRLVGSYPEYTQLDSAYYKGQMNALSSFTDVIACEFDIEILESICEYVEPTTFDLVLAAETGGTTVPVPGTYTENNGVYKAFYADPNSGYRFKRWLLSTGEQLTNPLAVIYRSTMTLVAQFIAQFQLTTSVTGNGTIIPSSGIKDDGETVTITVTPTDPLTYEFDKIEITDTDGTITVTTNTYSLLMNKAKSVVGYLRAILQYFDITITKVGNGTTTPFEGTQNIIEGTEITVTATATSPDDDDTALSVSSVPVSNPYTWIVAGIKSILATFSSKLNNPTQLLFVPASPSFSVNEVIDYSGKSNNGLLIKSNCLQPVTNITITLSTPRIGATIAELNTSTTEKTGVSINGSGHIDIVQASLVNTKIYQIKLSTGEEFVFSIGVLNKVYSISSTANTGTLSGVVTTNWIWTTQNDYHYNIKNGCNAWGFCDTTGTEILPLKVYFNKNWELTFEARIMGIGGILSNTLASGGPRIEYSSANMSVRASTSFFYFTNLGTSSITHIGNYKRVTLKCITTLGSYGGLTMEVCNLDGSSLVSQTLNFTSGQQNETVSLQYKGYYNGIMAKGSCVRNVKVTSNGVQDADHVYNFNYCYPILANSDFDVVGNACVRETAGYFAPCESKILVNPTSNQSLIDLGYSNTYEASYASYNPFEAKQFVTVNNNKSSNYVIYPDELSVNNLLQYLLTHSYNIYRVYQVGSNKLYTKITDTYGFIGIMLLTDASYDEYSITYTSGQRLLGLNNPLVYHYFPSDSAKLTIENTSIFDFVISTGTVQETWKIDNIRGECQNCRYVLHSEWETSKNKKIYARKINFKHLGNETAIAWWQAYNGTGSSVYNYPRAWGAGSGTANCVISVKDATLQGGDTGVEFITGKYGNDSFYYHSSTTPNTVINNVILKNVTLFNNTANRSLGLSNYNNGGDVVTLDNVILQNAADINFLNTHVDNYTNVGGVLNGYTTLI